MNYLTKKIIIISIATILSLTANHALAARLYFEPAKGNFSQNQILVVELKINTEDVPINTIEGYLNFSQDIFALESLSDGNSIINFWLKKPSYEKGLVSFSGIIPGGYNGRDGTIIKIILKPLKIGRGEIKIEEKSQVLANDGQGTKVKINYTAASLNIIKNGSHVGILPDTELPESFVPQIGKDSSLFDGQWFLTFSTQDKNSGIDHYEILETKDRKQDIRTGNWIMAESPYLLKDQKLESYIYVKAVDRSGNGKIASLSPKNIWYKKSFIYVAIGLITLIVLLLLIWLKKKLNR